MTKARLLLNIFFGVFMKVSQLKTYTSKDIPKMATSPTAKYIAKTNIGRLVSSRSFELLEMGLILRDNLVSLLQSYSSLNDHVVYIDGDNKVKAEIIEIATKKEDSIKLLDSFFNHLNISKDKDFVKDTWSSKDVYYYVPSKQSKEMIATCTKCSYGGRVETLPIGDNINKIDMIFDIKKSKSTLPSNESNMKLIHTPNAKTVDQLCSMLSCKPSDLAKTLLLEGDGKVFAIVIRGDRDLSMEKVKKLLGLKDLDFASSEKVEELTGAAVGFASPVGLKCPIYCDLELRDMVDFIAGGNKTDYHLMGVNLDDFTHLGFYDLIRLSKNHLCPVCNSRLRVFEGEEIAKVAENKAYIYLILLIFSLIEANLINDEMFWPEYVYPFEILILPVIGDNPVISDLSKKIHELFYEKSYKVLLDDRNIRIGAKFYDGDLLGIPYRIIVGRDAKDGKVEVKKRESDETFLLHIDSLISHLSHDKYEGLVLS